MKGKFNLSDKTTMTVLQNIHIFAKNRLEPRFNHPPEFNSNPHSREKESHQLPSRHRDHRQPLPV